MKSKLWIPFLVFVLLGCSSFSFKNEINNLASRENAVTFPPKLSDEPFSTEASLSNIMRAKEIPGYPRYFVSDKGDVWSKSYKNTGIPRKLIPNRNSKGYCRVRLCLNGVEKLFFVHRLVGIAFIPNPNNLPQINHKDMNKTNNHVDNLEWCDNRYNHLHSYKNGRKAAVCGESCSLSKLTEEEVIEIRSRYVKGVYGMGACVLAKEFGVWPSAIYSIVKNETWKHLL